LDYIVESKDDHSIQLFF